MIKSASCFNNLRLLSNSHLNVFTFNGCASKRSKATALNIIEPLEETKSNETTSSELNQNQKQKPEGHHQSENVVLSSRFSPAGAQQTSTSSSSNLQSLGPSSTKPSSLLFPKSVPSSSAALLLTNLEDSRLKYGHSGKALQDKIALERSLRSPSLLNLVFANRKLSFYDTFTNPDHDESKRFCHTGKCLQVHCRIMSESNASLLEDFIKSDGTENERLESNYKSDGISESTPISETSSVPLKEQVFQMTQVVEKEKDFDGTNSVDTNEFVINEEKLKDFPKDFSKLNIYEESELILAKNNKNAAVVCDLEKSNQNSSTKQSQSLNQNQNQSSNPSPNPTPNQSSSPSPCPDSLGRNQETFPNQNQNQSTEKPSEEKTTEYSIIEEDVIKEMLAGISRVKQKGTFVKIISQYLSHREQEQKHAEDVLFDMFYNEETGLISMGKFLASLKTTGIRKSDPRIRELIDNLKKVHKLSNYESGSSPETQHLNRETFKAVVAQNIVLIAKAFRQQFIIPDFAGFTKDVEDIYWKCKSNTSGKVADYIPQLARYSPDSWGVSICTIDGQRFSIGDVEVPFTLQSCSKPLTYAIALEKLGAEVVHSYIGQEPSGRNFNELVLDYNKKPHNPMINAGAILSCALLQVLIKPELTFAEKFDYTMSWFKRMSGGETIGFNNAVFLSEREAADRNYALGFYMRENKCYPKRTNLKEVMDFYFQCCSMETTCEAMSVIAATLANGGICPTTEEKVFRPEVVRDVLSIMHSCGTYDYSGQFAFKVGLPAKSGVSGGMMLVIPNVMGIFTWSPPLDQLGNPVRGVQFCEELVNAFNFHRFDNLKHASNKKDPRKHRYETKGLSIVNLLFSAASGDVTALRRHRLSGMDLTLADYDGRTALHLAASEGHLECVKFLLEHCRVPHNPKDRWGNMPIDEAQNFGHQSVIDYLTGYAEKAVSIDEANCETITSKTQADEEIKPHAIEEYDRSAAASPIPSEASSSGVSDNTRPGF